MTCAEQHPTFPPPNPFPSHGTMAVGKHLRYRFYHSRPLLSLWTLIKQAYLPTMLVVPSYALPSGRATYLRDHPGGSPLLAPPPPPTTPASLPAVAGRTYFCRHACRYTNIVLFLHLLLPSWTEPSWTFAGTGAVLPPVLPTVQSAYHTTLPAGRTAPDRGTRAPHLRYLATLDARGPRFAAACGLRAPYRYTRRLFLPPLPAWVPSPLPRLPFPTCLSTPPAGLSLPGWTFWLPLCHTFHLVTCTA